MSLHMKNRLPVLLILLALSVSMFTPEYVQAKKKKTIPTCRVNMFIGDAYTADKYTKVAKVSKKRMVTIGKNEEDDSLVITAKKSGTVIVTLKRKKKQTKIKMIISGRKDKALSLKIGGPVIGGDTNAGNVYSAELTNTSKIPITKADIGFNYAKLLEYYGDSSVYCLLPGKKVKIYLTVLGNPSEVSINHLTLTYNKFSTYKDISSTIELEKKYESSPPDASFTFSWKSKPSLSGTEKADFALDTTGYTESGVPVKTRYMGGDISTLNTISYTYVSSSGLEGVDAKAVSRAVKYTFDPVKWV